MNKIEKIKNLAGKIAQTEEMLEQLNRELKDLVNGVDRTKPAEMITGTAKEKVYEAVKTLGPVKRPDLLHVLGMPVGTVSASLTVLKEMGLIESPSMGVYKVK